MPEQIDPRTFDHLVSLAALELDADESEYLRRELNNQLNVIDEMAAIPLRGDEIPAARGVPYPPETTPPLRGDDTQPDVPPADILGQAPQADGGYIIVPDIPHTDLE
jgi:aspartyl/glutamyl-tRNA(Asn/Gln) amidotransferase C subunit